MNDFFVHTFSNACTGRYPENTLTKFINDLPITYDLSPSDNWHVCVKSIGFASKSSSILIPKREDTPCIRIFSRHTEGYNLEADVFFPSKHSDIETIKKSLEIIQDKNLGIKFYFDEDKNINIKFIKNDKHNKYEMLIHESITNSFGLPKSVATKTIKNDEVYYKFTLSEEKPDIHSNLKRWLNNHPDLIRIECDQISEQIFNGRLTKDLIIFCPSFEKKEKYTFHEFECEEYAPVSNTTLDKLSISLLNEKDEQLKLDYGVSTFVQLKFKKMPLTNESFNVRLSPMQTQDFNSFSIDLPQPYYLDSNWKVALTSINYPNMFRPLPFEERFRTIWTAKIGGKAEPDVLNNLMYSNKGLIDEIQRIFSSRGDLATFNILETEEYGVKKTDLEIIVRSGTFFLMPKHICEIFGYVFDVKYGINNYTSKYLSIFQDFVCFSNPDLYPISVKFGRHFNIHRLKPDYLMVYTDIIEQNIVGDAFTKLLKIIPVFHKSTDNYKIQEFKTREFHPLESTLLKKIKVDIRSHSGELINFAEGSKIFMNFLFSK